MDDKELIWTLLGIITALAAYIVKLHMAESKERKEQFKARGEDIKAMTEALVSTKNAVENNTKVMQSIPDTIFDKIGKATRK